jgi:methionyl-tRNA formyltransferase
MGSPAFSLPTLEVLIRNHNLVGVVTQPDRPAGRGRTLTPPPVKDIARKEGLAVIQPRRLSSPEAITQLKAWSPDLIVVAAFGQILKPAILDLPPLGSINVHASLLPRWRGAAPVQAAILSGDSETGVTIMRMDPGLDTGPIISRQALPIRADDTGGTLTSRLAELGAELLHESLPAFVSGELIPVAQDDNQATYAPMLKKRDGALNFQNSAATLVRQVRAYSPWPGTYTVWKGQNIKILEARAAPWPEVGHPDLAPAAHTSLDGWPAVATPDGLLLLDMVQPPGKRPLSGDEFLRGARDW